MCNHVCVGIVSRLTCVHLCLKCYWKHCVKSDVLAINPHEAARHHRSLALIGDTDVDIVAAQHPAGMRGVDE